MLWPSRALLLFFFYPFFSAEDEIWEQDLSADMKIGLSTTGYHRVDLRCGAEAFHVNLTLDDDFDGVLYTRGDFASKQWPCFQTKKDVLRSEGNNKALYIFKLPFNQCHTLEDASDQQFVNTLVLQHDPDFIMPGDAAFRLLCAFSPEQRLGSSILAGPKSSIVLVDADPASNKTSDQHSSRSDSDNVSFPKKTTSAPKEEL